MTGGSDTTTIQATVDEISEDAEGIEIAALVTDDGMSLYIPAQLLPSGARDGDVLTLRIGRRPSEKRARRSRIADLQRRLFGG